MTEQDLHSRLEEVESKHQELSQSITEKHEALTRELEEVKKKPAKSRDLWDKLGTVTPLISGVLISGIGIYFTHSNNVTQHKIQEVQTIEKLIPHLTGDDSEKKMAIIAISTLTNPATAAKIAQMFPSKGTVQALRSIADQGTKSEKAVARKALASSLRTLGEGMEAHGEKGAEAQQYYQKALAVEEDVYGADSSKTVDTLVKLGRISEKQGDPTSAITYYNRARQILIKNKMEKTRDFSSILKSLSRLYRQTGKMGLANDFKQKSANLDKQIDSGKVGKFSSHDSIIRPDPSKLLDDEGHSDDVESPDEFQPIQSDTPSSKDADATKAVPPPAPTTDTQLFPGGAEHKHKNSMDSPFSN